MFPGFVATLVEESYVQSYMQSFDPNSAGTADSSVTISASVSYSDIITPSTSSSSSDRNITDASGGGSDVIGGSSEIICSGLVWFIPSDRVKATIEELDYRERGGYHRYLHIF